MLLKLVGNQLRQEREDGLGAEARTKEVSEVERNGVATAGRLFDARTHQAWQTELIRGIKAMSKFFTDIEDLFPFMLI